MSDGVELIRIDGVAGEYPKLSTDGLPIQYWCDLCGEKPEIIQGVVAMVLRHDACFSKQFVEASKSFQAPKIV